jgi:hypothetical protein
MEWRNLLHVTFSIRGTETNEKRADTDAAFTWPWPSHAEQEMIGNDSSCVNEFNGPRGGKKFSQEQASAWLKSVNC